MTTMRSSRGRRLPTIFHSSLTLRPPRSCIPVRLEGGRTWCVPDADADYPVLAITAGGHQDTRVGDLVAGDEIIISAGDWTGTVHGRLVAAVPENAELAALDALLAQ